jgi:oxygen-independent coproporphyrinogen-3 oxidase
MDKYYNTLVQEIQNDKPDVYDTVFIGGGTPTALPLPLLLNIVSIVAKEGCEFTVEVNPATLSANGFMELRQAGVNRISIGLQTAIDSELATLGRIHTFDDFLVCYDNARKAGFNNINIDLMFGLPKQTITDFKYSLERIINLQPEHLSCYCLSIEENTPFHSMQLDLPDEEATRQMYQFCANHLTQNGYHHYEISNFAKPGFECKHNLKYWERKQYYGFGAGAHSLIKQVRFENSADICEYLKGNIKTKTVLSEKDIKNEYIFLGLRKTNGIDLTDYKLTFRQDFLQEHKEQISKYIEYCSVRDNRFFLTLDGLTVSNTIIADFLE